MKIGVFETADWEHQACSRLAEQGEFQCTQEPLNDSTVSQYSNAEVVGTFINSELDNIEAYLCGAPQNLVA